MKKDILTAHIDFLRQHEPFNRMSPLHVEYMAKRLELGFYAKGEIITEPARGPASRFYIVKQGRVRGETAQVNGSPGMSVWELVAGECFPIGALLSHRPVRTIHRAVEETFCLELDHADFNKLVAQSPVFQDFCTRRLASLLGEALRLIPSGQATGHSASMSDTSLNSPLESLMRKSVLSCTPETPLRQALQAMTERRVGSMVITDRQQKPLGILTTVDVLTRIALPEISLDTAIGEVMTPEPKILSPRAFAYDAALLMAEHGIRHVCVVENSRLQGIVSERDLFYLQRVGLGNLSQSIIHAEDLSTLRRLSKQIVHLTDQMLSQGTTVDQLVRIITTLNDHITRRVIALCEVDNGEPAIPYTWLAFGSEGREEQTLKTDQDNGILFAVSDRNDANRARAQLLPLASRINHALAEVGFPLCMGNIMAGNPECCLSMDEWKARFRHWIEHGSPEHLLKASIFFDFRAIHGDATALEELRGWLLEHAAANDTFLRQMAENALRNRPPLGLVRDFVVASGGEHADTIDLKLNGAMPFVDGARLFALAGRLGETSTIARFRAAARHGKLREKEVSAWCAAYDFIQLLRMRTHRQQESQGLPLDNHINPDTLNELDQRILKESFRQVRKLQNHLALEYRL